MNFVVAKRRQWEEVGRTDAIDYPPLIKQEPFEFNSANNNQSKKESEKGVMLLF